MHSHVHALPQCRRFIRDHGLEPVVHADTAGAAADIAKLGDPSEAAIATTLAAEIYGLDTLASNIDDADHNTTRFVIMSKEPNDPEPGDGPVITSFVFRVRSVPAALYKALGGFATNGVNITKLESYILDGAFTVAQFYADIEGHPHERPVAPGPGRARLLLARGQDPRRLPGQPLPRRGGEQGDGVRVGFRRQWQGKPNLPQANPRSVAGRSSRGAAASGSRPRARRAARRG